MAKAAGFTAGAGDTEVLRGGARLRRTLRQAGDDLTDLKEAHARAAKIVEPVAVAKAPKASGALAATGRSSGTKTAGMVRFGSRSVPYAGVRHFGTERARSEFWQKRRIVGRPFAIEAARDTEPQWGRIYQDAVDKAISRIQGA